MTDVDSYHSQTAPLRAIEQRLLADLSTDVGVLARRERDTLRLALSLARLQWVATEHGDVDVFEGVAPFRHWLLEQLRHFVPDRERQRVDIPGLRRLMPAAFQHIEETRRHLIEHEANRFSVERLDDELRNRQLVLALGGGGGCGYAHLGLLAVVSELGFVPRMIVGASMGALVGLYRAISVDYDPIRTALALPRPSDFARVFAPYRGFSRFGFPGSLEVQARTIGEQTFMNLMGRSIPRISELPIRFRAIGTGLKSGIGLAITDVEEQINRVARSRFSPNALRRRVLLFARIMRWMVNRSGFLDEIVFGQDEGLRDFNCVDAVGFSVSVPGVLHYDLYGRQDASVEAMRQIFARRGLFRVTDGGVVSNVPARAAWRAAMSGELGNRNLFVLSADAFAPQINRNAPFYPVQQLAAIGTRENLRWSDHHVVYRNPPSPLQVLQSMDGLQSIIARTRTELEPMRPLLDLALRPLPRFETLRDAWRHDAA